MKTKIEQGKIYETIDGRKVFISDVHEIAIGLVEGRNCCDEWSLEGKILTTDLEKDNLL